MRIVIAKPEDVEAAYEKVARQMGLLKANERVSMWPKQQAIVVLSDEPNEKA